MCGIAGILTSHSGLELESLLSSMRTALRHRGPDDEGQVVVETGTGWRLGLAHTRLSILDLSSAAHQPMVDPKSGSWIVYNGEVYNHQDIRRQLRGRPFRSSSDTETILRSYVSEGERILSSFRGMFAFVLYDGQRRQLWLVRDRLGVKPLYVSQVDGQTWVFASELRAVLESGLVPRRLNQDAVESYLAFGAVPAPWTLIDGIQSLMPAERWRFDLNRTGNGITPERQRYWRPRFVSQASSPPRSREGYQEALETVQAALPEAVALRMLSDVPVGVFLSGGIDSSSLVALLATMGHSVHTFSVVFGERQFDESEHARRIARRFSTRHEELLLRPNQVLEQFHQAVSAYDQPSIDGVNIYFISQAARHAGLKVALSGVGGDELFAGYPYFRLMNRLERPLMRFSTWFIYQALRHIAPRHIRTQKLGVLLGGNKSVLERYCTCRQVMLPVRRRMLCDRFGKPTCPALPLRVLEELANDVAPLDSVNAQSHLEISLYLANMLLRDMDQMSMAHGLEVREPLLDHVLVEAVAGLPGWCKLMRGHQSPTKGLLVDALSSTLPREVLERPKSGFVFPWEHWLRGELRDSVAATLSNSSAVAAIGLNPKAVLRLWYDYRARRPGVRYSDILSLVHLVEWASAHALRMDHCDSRIHWASPANRHGDDWSRRVLSDPEGRVCSF